MPANLLAQARADAAKFVASGGFSVAITLTRPDNSMTVDVNGLGTGRWVNFDDMGNSVNSSKNHVTIAESDLNTSGYVVRNSNGKVALYHHQVSYTDNNGTVKNYLIEEVMPNETSGLIVCILGKA